MTPARWLIALLLLAGCSGGGAPAGELDGAPTDLPSLADTHAAVRSLDELLAAYEAGTLTLEQLRANVEATSAEAASELSGAFDGVVLLRAGAPVAAVGDEVVIEAGGALVLAPGAELVLPEAGVLRVHGALYALGETEAPARIHGPDEGAFETLDFHGRGVLWNTDVARATTLLTVSEDDGGSLLVSDCRFDHWSNLALSVDARDDVLVRGCNFGLDTPYEEQEAETVRALGSGVVFEDCVFGPRRGYRDVLDLEDCLTPPFPVLRGCRFLGGEDDAIDLDDCHALVVGNEIRDFRPADLDAPRAGVNGGGITGDRNSQPLIVGNVIVGCYHAVGFKNGARPVLVNNTILDSNIGVTLYQGDASQPLPHGVLVNNILWNNRDWESDEVQDVVLNGRWWPGYSQAEGDQATLEASHNLVTSELEGTDNLAGDPLLETEDGVPLPSPDSPALDSGLEAGFEAWLDAEVFPLDVLLAQLAADFRGQPRACGEGACPGIDRGAVERSPDL